MGAGRMTVSEFLGRAASTPFQFGRWDCQLWLADWLVASGHPDPAADFRGRYRTALGAQRLLNREGGAVALVTRLAERAALASLAVDAPEPGAIGLVRVVGRRGRAEPAGALFGGLRWQVLRAGGGLIAFPATPIACWKV
jgi:hypothetical protein